MSTRPLGTATGLVAGQRSPARGADGFPPDPEAEWEEVGDVEGMTPFYEFAEAGAVIEGQLVGTKRIRDRDLFVLEDIAGKRWLLPEHSRLMRKLALCQTGEIVRITYEGEETFESRSFGTVTAKMYTVKKRKVRAPQPVTATADPDGGDDHVPF